MRGTSTIGKSLSRKKGNATLGELVEPGKPIESLKKKRSKLNVKEIFEQPKDKDGKGEDKKNDDGKGAGGASLPS